MQDIDFGLKKLSKSLKAFRNKKLEVGVFADAGTNDNGEKIADYAIANEYGTLKNSKQHIPARSFVGKTYDRNEKKYEKLMNNILDNILLGKDTNVDVAISRVGEVVRNDIVKAIDSNIAPANAESTKKKKKSAHTLIDTGALRQSVEVRIKNV